MDCKWLISLMGFFPDIFSPMNVSNSSLFMITQKILDKRLFELLQACSVSYLGHYILSLFSIPLVLLASPILFLVLQLLLFFSCSKSI